MKTQFKRFSKSTISVLLAVCLLFSCMTVGIIATDAAKTADERIGASETYTVYFDNSVLGWDNIYVYSGSEMYIDKRVYKPGSSTKMTTHDGDIYSITMTVNNGKIAFSDANMGGWNDFYGNNAVWSDTITSTKNQITPDTKNTWESNSTHYTYGNASAYVAPETTYAVTVNNGDHGIVSPTTVNAGETAVDLSSAVTVTPAGGWTHTGWTATSPASVSGNNLTATGTGGSVTPTYARIPCYVYGDIDGVNEWSNTTAHAMTYDCLNCRQ